MYIKIQFPEHTYEGTCQLPAETFENDLITKFSIVPQDETIKSLMTILMKFYTFGSTPVPELGEIWLGNSLEDLSYHFIGTWPHSINFGYLDFNSSPDFDLEITWKFKTLHHI